MNCDDVGVIESGDGAGLAFETLAAFRIGCHVWRQYLECHVALQFRVVGAIHLAHPSRPDQPSDLVVCQARARRQVELGGGSAGVAH
jgi:hypothetical protein